MSKQAILKKLTKTEGFISGEVLSQELGISRTAVWKSVKRLKEEGYDIQSVRNKGYWLVGQSTEVVEDTVRMALATSSRFKDIYVYNSVGSTNTQGKKLWQQGDIKEALILAKEQTAGKGRRGRQWLSPKDQGVFMSMVLTPDIAPRQGSMLTLIAGVAVCRAIEHLTTLKPQIKWPNDVVIDHKKVCGILTEMSGEMDLIHFVVIGMGINVNQVTFDEAIKETATSIRMAQGDSLSRPRLIGEVARHFEESYEQFLINKNLDFLLEAYNARCINVGRQLKVVYENKIIEGIGIGANSDGTLEILQPDGTTISVNSGEVSVRGLKGYI